MRTERRQPPALPQPRLPLAALRASLRDHTVLREGLLHALLLVVVLAATVVGYNNPAPMLVQADTAGGDVLRGFHEIEFADGLPFRWTRGAGTVCAEQMGYAPRYLVRVTLLGEGAAALGIGEVGFLVDEQPVLTAPLRPALHTYTFLVDSSYRQGDNMCITIASATAESPAATERRRFGVPFYELTLYPNVSTGPTLPARGMLALNMAAALVGFWLLRVVGVRPPWAALTVAAVALALGTAMAAGVVAAGVGVAPRLLMVAGIGALVLAGSLGLRWLDQERAAQPVWLQRRLGRDLAAMVLWSLVLWGAVRITQAVSGHSGAWPLKAGVWPNFTPLVVVPLALFAGWLALLVLQLRRSEPRLLPALATLVGGAVVLPVALKSVVRGWNFLYITFGPTQMDYIADVPLVGGDPLGFLGRYVELSPTLSLHSSTHPPGSILLLWLVENIFGAGPVPATWAVIVLGSLGILAAFWLALHLGGRHVALLAGALWVAMPGHQVYSVTSMDSVFNGIMALGMVAFFLALEPEARPWRAALAGALIALALFFTYAATQLFFFGAAVCVLALARQRRLLPVLRQGAIAAGVLVLLYVLLYLATGFNVIEGAVQATDNNATMLGKPVAGAGAGLFVPPGMEQYLYYVVVNLVPFAWYIAPWGLAAFVPVVVAGTRAWPRPDRWHTLALALVVLVLGMVLAGLFNREVERIWSFVYPLAAVVMVRHIWQGDTPRERVWRAGLWVSLFFAQSAVMRMLLNTYW